MTWRIATAKQLTLSNAVTFRSSGCWLGENASEKWQRALATALTGFGFLLVATTRMGRTHLPISVSTIKALHRFSLGNKRGNCNTPLNFALQTTDCGLAPKWLTGWASK